MWVRARVGALIVALVSVTALDMPSRAAESPTVEVLGTSIAATIQPLDLPLPAKPVEATSTTTTSPATTAPATTLSSVATPRGIAADASVDQARVVETAEVTGLTVAEEALAAVRFDWEAAFPDWQIVFLGDRSGIRALTYPREHRIEVFVRKSESAQSLHRVIAHELGHVVDVELNDADERNSWLAQRGISGDVPWWPDESAPDFATGAGDFAEAFAVWETGVSSQSTLAAQPSPADLTFLAALIG